MSTWAIITNGIVENIIVSDSKENAMLSGGNDWVEYVQEPNGNQPYIGIGYADGVFEQPQPIEGN